MSCIFCESWTHFPQNCDLFVSDVSRIKIMLSKNRCKCCLSKLDDNYHTIDSCYFDQKCYICFTQLHDTVLCPERFKSPIFFKPSIDTDLFARFLQMLNLDEKYLIAFASFDLSKMLNLKPLKVITHFTINDDYIKEHSDLTILVTDVLKASNLQNDSIIPYASNNMIVKAKIINLENIKIQSKHFLQFTSPKTKLLYCNNLQFTTPVTFAEILNKLPEIEEMDFQRSNVDFGISWPQELLQSENSSKLKTLKFTLNDVNFCAKTLAEFMIKHNNILIVLCCNNFNGLKANLSKSFIAPDKSNYKGSLSKIFCFSSWSPYPSFQQFYKPIINLSS